MTAQLNNFIAISSEAIRNCPFTIERLELKFQNERQVCHSWEGIPKRTPSMSFVGKSKKIGCFHATSFGGNERSCPTAIKRENQKKPRGCF